ncbi:hypothetical protein VitviT2T_027055 [Vitis vinifera]|uniref:Beta-galactosidase n=2 Tax=Vitis vinifera TaxID=29760 RepID=E0CR37_VITVI|eukprot:XP_019072164.1 PREDICTED: beta-galactosidase 16 isoform X1 [Vitis vinifera]
MPRKEALEMRSRLLLWFAVLSAAVAVVCGGSVTYDGRSLIINGQRRLLFSGSIHYPRSTPEMWPSLISKAKEGGIDVIETYAFWNQHEPKQGQYDFSGRLDIVKFFKEVQAQGLYACLRIGPFIESEWNYGGLPFWLHDVPGIIYRSDNEPFKFYMQNFTTKIVNLMKSENLYASQGGPIILSQIENEYKNVEAAFHEKGPPYVRWAAKMAVDLQTGVPWVMCKQDDAPDPVINACNGMKCGETFAGPNKPNKPAIWTENWTSVYEVYGEDKRGRAAEDLAFQVALFIAKKNGSFINYYMYHGGTNFGRTSSSYVLTAYYDQAPLDEYGLIRQPKWGHLKELHAVIKLCSDTLLHGVQYNYSLGQLQEAYLFKRPSGQCAAFLVNNDKRRNVTVLFQNTNYELAANSISILPDCKKIAFNTAKVSTQFNTRSVQTRATFGSTKQWSEYREGIPSFGGTPLKASMLLEHMGTTKDASDYLWYTLRFIQNSSNAQPVLRVDSLAHVLHAFVNGKYIASAHGSHQNGSFSLVNKVPLNSGLNRISLLSVMVGLPDAGPYLEHKVAGIRRVEIQDGGDSKDFSKHPWGYQVGLMGEKSQIYTSPGSQKVQWHGLGSHGRGPLTWYKTLFDAPPGNDPVVLFFGSMGKGEAWVNGQSIGRYWVSYLTPSGEPSQTWYNVPRAFLNPKGNLLVVQEEESGDPLKISIGTVSVTNVCGHVTDSHPPPIISWTTSDDGNESHHGKIPKVQLRCPPSSNISKITFASFGTPVGGCESYAIGSCHSPNSLAVAEKACLGKNMCSIPHSLKSFGDDPCPGTPKALLVAAQCK